MGRGMGMGRVKPLQLTSKQAMYTASIVLIETLDFIVTCSARRTVDERMDCAEGRRSDLVSRSYIVLLPKKAT